jgi:hypothetical protein
VPKIEHISTGCCARRAMAGHPCFFVFWTDDGTGQALYFVFPSDSHKFADRLRKQAKELKIDKKKERALPFFWSFLPMGFRPIFWNSGFTFFNPCF